MTRGRASGYSLDRNDAQIVLGMILRGDRHHDIAAWFGVNQGRIAEVSNGSHGAISAAPAESLPPKGPPGIKGRGLREVIARILELAESEDINFSETIDRLHKAVSDYDSRES